MYRICTLVPLFLLIALVSAGCSQEPSKPGKTVKTLMDQVKEGKVDEAMAIVDMDQKAALLFGDLYTNGEQKDKERTREILMERFKEALVKENEALARGAEGPKIRSKMLNPELTKAEVRVEHSNTVFIYTLELRENWKDMGRRWIIVDRTHENNGIRSSITMGVKSVMNRAERTYGHTPSLAELNELLPEAMGSIKIRGFRVGAPAPSAAPNATKAEPETAPAKAP